MGRLQELLKKVRFLTRWLSDWKTGATLDQVLKMLKGMAPDLRSPVVLFTYYNPIRARGLDNFCRDIKAAGASGTAYYTPCFMLSLQI